MKLIYLLPALLLSSCGVFKLWEGSKERKIAALPAQEWMREDKESFSIMLDEKLHALHSYYLIGQKNLVLFDSQIASMDLDKLYQSAPYYSLMAVRTQVEEIEHELVELSELNQKDDKAREMKSVLFKKIETFATNRLAQRSMENLRSKLGLAPYDGKSAQGALTVDEIDSEYQNTWNDPVSAVYEKNIEHLSHMFDKVQETNSKRFSPSTQKDGNITGNEFPAKVWSLTFDDGPGKNTSPIILKNLKDRGLRATFFQLTQQVNSLTKVAQDIRDSGMEIACHSYSHQQLTKVGAVTLEKEITQALRDQEKALGVKVKFFRLPYGAGVNSPNIREKIAANNLIHVFWNIDTLDWMAQEPSKIVERTIGLMSKTQRDAGVLLFHDIHQRTADATVHIMDHLKKDGRRVCTLDEIVTQMNENAETVCPPK